MHKPTCLLAAVLALSLPGLAAVIPPSADVAEVETLYAELADSYGVISTIDSGLFATYRGKDRAAWDRIYDEKRKILVEKLSKISVSGLSPLDARARSLMNGHLSVRFAEMIRTSSPAHLPNVTEPRLRR